MCPPHLLRRTATSSTPWDGVGRLNGPLQLVEGRKCSMRLSRTLAAVALTTALVVTAGCSSGKTDNKSNSTAIQKVNYMTSFRTFGRESYVYVAIEKGYFKDAGLDVTVT